MVSKVVKGLTLILNTVRYSRSTQRGFTLLEILIALFLMSTVFLVIDSATTSRRDQIISAVSQVERALRFAVNESILRGSITRIKFDLEKDPPTYIVEYGPKDSFVLPEFSDFKERSNLSLSEFEKLEGELKKIDNQFQPVDEASEGPVELSGGVKIYGVSTEQWDELIISGQVSIYIYPTGEKDSSIIIFSYLDELASLIVSPFTDSYTKNYQPLEGEGNAGLEDAAKELYQKWKKN